MKYFYVAIFLIFGYSISYAQRLEGYITNRESNQALPGVQIRNKSVVSLSDTTGYFIIDAKLHDTLTVTAMGYQQKLIPVSSLIGSIHIALDTYNQQLETVEVISNGYQSYNRERSTGSVNVISNGLLNRGVSPTIMGRLENLTPGLLFNRGDAKATDAFLIRGRSTITANAQPLIVLDDFPYDGALENINPNDVSSVVILKDAAASAIWGARAGNGVIVIRTKRGYSQKPTVTINNTLTLQGKPDLYNVHWMSSADKIEWEQYLYNSGYYNSAKQATNITARTTPIPEAVELMIRNPADLEQQLAILKSRDVRSDLNKYLYQDPFQEQHSFNMSGAQEQLNYVFSGGFDRQLSELVADRTRRFTLRTVTSYEVNKSLRLNAEIQYVQNIHKQGNNSGINTFSDRLSPYAQLADNLRNALPYYSMLRKGFVDTVGQGHFLDWTYRPIEDIQKRLRTNNIHDFLVNTGLSYRLFAYLKLELKYQYQNQLTANDDWYREDSYFARDLVNRFTSYSPVSGQIDYPVPIGGVLTSSHSENNVHQGRLQLNFQHAWAEKHELTGLAGYEIRSSVITGNDFRYYGYQEEQAAVNGMIDYTTPLATNVGSYNQIPLVSSVSRKTDHFLSAFANAAYTYLGRYTLTGSIRKDEANLFGVKTNEKGVPLWSIGAAWQLNKESFYHMNLIPALKFRVNYGVSGNISRLSSANTILRLSSDGQSHNMPTAEVVSPPNAKLRWERVQMLDAGMDFAAKNNRLSGTFDLYFKNSTDLLAEAPTDPTLGFSSVYSNVACLQNRGLDLQLNSINLQGPILWQSSLIYSFTSNKLTKYLMPVTTNGSTYAQSVTTIKPVKGRPIFGVYSYPWAGLDPQTGAPLGYLHGEVSDDYMAMAAMSLESMEYSGPVQPEHYGAIRNTISYHDFSFSFNISYKLGAWFRSQSVNNGGLLAIGAEHSDFAKRWQKPGDELHTYVPSMIYPIDNYRNSFYDLASIHILKADEVRLEDIQLSYLLKSKGRNSFFKQCKLYIYTTNLGLLWKANKSGIDPEYNEVPLAAAQYSFGILFTF